MAARSAVLRAALGLALAAASLSLHGPAAATGGTFRFLTQSLPVGSTNAEYVSRVLTANAGGPVTFSVDAGTPLPGGMALASDTGVLTGRPTSTFNDPVTFHASDGLSTIDLTVTLRVNSSGGGGNEGSTFGGLPLASGRVGAPYTHTVTVQNGVGPYVFGAASLPAGLRLDGLTGTISGTPIAPGTFHVSLSVTDHGEGENKVVTSAPLTVLPAASDLAFATRVLDNGEVGTPYCENVVVTRTVPSPLGAVSYSASGLPAGLAIDPATGLVTGTPAAAGTFETTLTASDGADTVSTNLAMVVVPSATSRFHWDFFGIPNALVNVAYARQPPILVAAANGTSVTYAATGLPAGITYSATTGELAGSAAEVGIYPVTFTATDAAASASITLTLDFLVLPPSGGDASSLAVNAWVTKSKLRPGEAGAGAWKGALVYNADRRAGRAFDPLTQTASAALGSNAFVVPAAGFRPVRGGFAYRSARGEEPSVSMKLAPAKQAISWSVGAAAFPETLPGAVRQAYLLGARGWRIDTFVEERGKLAVPSGLRTAAFVVAKARIDVRGPGEDSVNLAFLLCDPSLDYESGVSTLRLRLVEGANVLLDRDFTALGTGTIATGVGGSVAHTIRTAADTATADRITKFQFKGATGKGTLSIAAATLPALGDAETHVGAELTVGTRTYYTGVTFFERRANRYSVP